MHATTQQKAIADMREFSTANRVRIFGELELQIEIPYVLAMSDLLLLIDIFNGSAFILVNGTLPCFNTLAS